MTGPERTPVTVIGLGPMGRAMAGVLLDAGHPVTVWNRTPGRADELVARGAVRADDPATALRAAGLVLLSLTDYQAMDDILGGTTPADGSAADPLAGRVLVNLSSDTPERTRGAADWAAGRGATFLVGGVMSPAPMLGGEGAYVYYSGPRAAFDAHAGTLARIGEPRYVGADPGLAQLYYQAQLDVFLTTLAAILHATALVGRAGVPAREFLPELMGTVVGIPALMGGGEATGRELDAGEYPGDLSTTLMMGATAEHVVRASEAAGIDLALPLAVRSLYDRAIAAGHGRDNWTSLIEVIRNAV